LTADELIEIAIKVYCLSVGSFFILYFWNLRNSNITSLKLIT
jgi:hypothetical protein